MVGEGTVQKYIIINHQAGTTKASTRIKLVQIMYNIFRLLTGVPDYNSSSEVMEKNKN